MGLSHYKFIERLKEKGETSGKKVVIARESYMTQVCGQCMNGNKEIKSKKICECEKCKLKTERDVNATWNILLKYIKNDKTILKG